MQLGEQPGEWQAESRPVETTGQIVLELHERKEYAIDSEREDADPRVRDRDLDQIAVDRRRDFD